MLRYLVFTYFVQYCSGFAAPQLKYIVLLDSPIYPFGEESSEFVDTSDVRVERLSESEAVMSGNMKFKKEIGENTMVTLTVLKEASGKMETVFTHDICNFCDEIGNKESDYDDMLKYFGFPDKCPIEPGSYPIHDFAMDSEKLDLKSSHIGRYEAELLMWNKTGDSCQNDKKFMFCMKIDCVVDGIES